MSALIKSFIWLSHLLWFEAERRNRIKCWPSKLPAPWSGMGGAKSSLNQCSMQFQKDNAWARVGSCGGLQHSRGVLWVGSHLYQMSCRMTQISFAFSHQEKDQVKGWWKCAAQTVITVKHLTHSVSAFDQTIGCKLPAVPLNQVFISHSYVLFLFESRDCDLILMHYLWTFGVWVIRWRFKIIKGFI